MKTLHQNRPLSPRLGIYHWRLTMLASITHRASGIFLVMVIPAYLWLLLSMSHGATAYRQGLLWLQSAPGTFILWLTCVALFYHFINGIRFLLLDIGKTDSRDAMKLSAKLVIFSTALFALVWAVIL